MRRETGTQESCVIRPDLTRQYPVVSHGEGIYLYAEGGQRFIDGCSGAITANIGHGVAEIAEAAARQAKAVSFVYRTQFTSRPLEDLARWIVDRTPGLGWLFFVNSGSEATEAALRLALQHWQERGEPWKLKILSRRVSYHGMTLGALGVSGHYNRRHRYLPLLQESPDIAAPYCYRCPFKLDPGSCQLECADDLERAIQQIGANHVAAFIAEPIVGASGGAITPPPGYFQRIREICERHDVLFIADEVMTGLGRTGAWLGLDHWGVKPDIAVLGKGLSAGYAPIAAILASDTVIEPLRSGTKTGVFGHTYSGNPQSAAIALAVLQYVERDGLITRARLMGEILGARLQKLARRTAFLGDVRGKGLLWGLELVEDRATKKPFSPARKAALALTDCAFAEGLLVYPCRGMIDLDRGDAVLVAPPLTITAAQIDELVCALERSLTAFAERGFGAGE